MIICICRRLNSRKVKEAIDAGATTPGRVMAHHGQRFNCGACRCAIADMLSAETDVREFATPQLTPAE